MKNKNKRALPVYFFILSALLLISAELLLNYFGKSLCQAKTCEIASNLLIIPKIYLLFLALIYFVLLFLLTKIYLYTEGALFLNLLLFAIIAGFSGDILFISKLIFEYQLICYFCVGIFLILFFTILSYLYLFRGFKFNTSILFFIIFGLIFGIIAAYKITTPDLISLNTFSKSQFLIYSQDCPRCKELLSKINPKNTATIPFYQIYPIFKVFDFNTVPILIEKQNSTWIIYTAPEDIEKKLSIKNSHLKEIPCDNETQGGLCVLP
ncbi:MAG: hypothetical protein ABWJ99_04860 [Caldimicrobium sp.]